LENKKPKLLLDFVWVQSKHRAALA